MLLVKFAKNLSHAKSICFSVSGTESVKYESRAFTTFTLVAKIVRSKRVMPV